MFPRRSQWSPHLLSLYHTKPWQLDHPTLETCFWPVVRAHHSTKRLSVVVSKKNTESLSEVWLKPSEKRDSFPVSVFAVMYHSLRYLLWASWTSTRIGKKDFFHFSSRREKLLRTSIIIEINAYRYIIVVSTNPVLVTIWNFVWSVPDNDLCSDLGDCLLICQRSAHHTPAGMECP